MCSHENANIGFLTPLHLPNPAFEVLELTRTQDDPDPAGFVDAFQIVVLKFGRFPGLRLQFNGYEIPVHASQDVRDPGPLESSAPNLHVPNIFVFEKFENLGLELSFGHLTLN